MIQVMRNGRCFNVSDKYHYDWWVNEYPQWEHDVSDFIEEHVRPDMVALDIGSWNGVHALHMATITPVVYALEPDPLAYEILNINRQCNPALSGRLKPRLYALSNETGEIEIMTGGGSGSSILKGVQDLYPEIGKARVKCFSFFDFLATIGVEPDDIGFIKMDIEGAEKLCIPDMSWFFEKHYDGAMSLSLHPTFMSDEEMQRVITTMEVYFTRVSEEGWIKKK